MSCNEEKFTLGVRNIILGVDTKQKTCIKVKADVGGDKAGKAFVFHKPVTQEKHVVWLDNGSAVAPTIPNATLHPVVYVDNDSKNVLAGKIATVLDGLALVDSAVATGAEIEMIFADPGYAYECRDALDPAVKTGFKFYVSQFGRVQEDLGPTNGDVVFTSEEMTKEITAPQTGDFILGEIRRGSKIGVKFELKETAEAQIRRAINFYGSTFVTDDAASEVISGHGSSNLFKSTTDVATQLILRAPEYAEANDSSDDFTVLKARLKLGEVTFSSENELSLPVSAVGYLDKSKASMANLWSYGSADKIPSV